MVGWIWMDIVIDILFYTIDFFISSRKENKKENKKKRQRKEKKRIGRKKKKSVATDRRTYKKMKYHEKQ